MLCIDLEKGQFLRFLLSAPDRSYREIITIRLKSRETVTQRLEQLYGT